MMATELNDILKLSLSERVLWAEALWNSIVGEKDSNEILEVSPEHKKILDRELLSFKKNPASGASWEDVKSRIRKKK